VFDVRPTGFKADIRPIYPVQCVPKETNIDDIVTFLVKNDYLVALIELYPVFDETGDFYKTALAIEHLRFYFNHIWRGWDDEEEDDFIYVDRHLEPRLKLYYDMQSGTLATETVKKYTAKLEEYKVLYAELTKMRNELDCSDSEHDISESSLMELTLKYQRIKSYEQSLQVMENPMMRLMISHHESFNGSMPGQSKGPRPDGSVITHIVTERLTVGMLQDLPSDTIIKEYETPSCALCSCFDGDTVLIYPGNYPADGFYDLQDSITIMGIDDIIIDCGQGGDISVDCHATVLTIANLTFVQHGTDEGILCVRHGMTTLDNCLFQCDARGVVVRRGAELTMKKCEVQGAKSAGVTVHDGSIAVLNSNNIHHCGTQVTEDCDNSEGGILIKACPSEDNKPKVKLTGNQIHHNSGYGITVMHTMETIDTDMDGKDVEVLKGVNIENVDNNIYDNSSGCIGALKIE
uniref:SHC SH2 domain-binding protein 1-like n=1 Tax=Saccoglossus kowalevskii TaxID=10224 RepID=A0ABM0GKQ4_SACKO